MGARANLICVMRARGYVTVKQAASIASCSLSSMYLWLSQGQLESTSVGPTKFVSLASLKIMLGDAYDDLVAASEVND